MLAFDQTNGNTTRFHTHCRHTMVSPIHLIRIAHTCSTNASAFAKYTIALYSNCVGFALAVYKFNRLPWFDEWIQKNKKMCTANGQLFVSILLCSVFEVTERQRFCRFSSLFAPNTIDRFLYLIYIVAASRYTYPNYARINQIDKEQIAFKHNKHHSRTIHFWFEWFARCDKSRSIFQAKL